MALANPPILEYLFLEQPYPAIIAAIAVAAIFWTLARRHERPKLRLVSAAAVLAALGIFLASTFITTDRQRVLENTRALVAATEQNLDMPTVRRLLAPNATLSGPDGNTWLRLPDLLDELERAHRRYTVSSHNLSQLDAEVGPAGHARSAFRLRTELGVEPGASFPTRWRLTWSKTADDQWQVTDIQWTEFLHSQQPYDGIWRR